MPSITRALTLTNADCRKLASGTYKDTKQPGLLYRVGVKRRSFYYSHDTTLNGARAVTSKLLGQFDPAKFGISHARKEAAKVAGRIASGRGESKQKFEDAFDEYVAMLRRKRSATWANIVAGIGRNHLLPKWKSWRLDKLARSPKLVREWHRKLSNDVGETTADHAARILRATYLNAVREDTSLPRDRHPCTSVEYNEQKPRQIGEVDWKAWAAAWRKIENPVRKSFHLFQLLSGTRPGEAARLRLDGFNAKLRTWTITKTKSGMDAVIPLSLPIVRALRIALDVHDGDTSFVFPGRRPKGHIVRFDQDGLPWFANASRHVYISVAAAIGIDDVMQHMLTTHAPRGVHQGYFVQMIVRSGPAMRAAQRQVSAEIMRRLGIKL